MTERATSARPYIKALSEGTGDDRLAGLLLQLVQAVKHEPYHDSALARTLVCRALLSPVTVGRPLFWRLRSEAVRPGRYCPPCSSPHVRRVS